MCPLQGPVTVIKVGFPARQCARERYRTNNWGVGKEGNHHARNQPASLSYRGGVMNKIISGLTARWQTRTLAAAAAILIGTWFAAGPVVPAAVAAPVAPAAGAVAPSTTGGAFGPNVYVFTPSMSQATIQSTLDSIASEQVSNQFGAQRYAVLFEPGPYGSTADPLIFQVGYYTTVAGLGLSPSGVVINGSIDGYNQCFAATPPPTP